MSLKSEKAHMRPDQLKLLDALGRLHTTVAPDRKLWVTAKIDFRILDYFGIDKLTALPDDRHKLAKPMPRVLAQLRSDGNRYRLAMDAGIDSKQWDDLLCKLDRIGHVVPASRRRWNSPRRNVRVLAEHIVNYWESARGEEFSQYWHESNEPLTPGTIFLKQVFDLIDPDAIKLLPGVTRKIVKDRNRATKSRRRKKLSIPLATPRSCKKLPVSRK